MKIKVDVNNVTIMEKSDIHKGEYNVNKCIFEFSSEYTKDLIYRAVFSCINGSFYQLILNNECNIPEEILREKDVNIELGVYAYILNDDNELELRYSPKPTYFRVENGSYKDADKTEVPSPTDYEKFLNEFNRNATNKTEEFNKNYEDKIKSYNDNSIQKTNEYNKNADEKIKEINNKVSDVEKIEENIEQIQKNVQASEQNAKTSETNAKTSEQSAQKSAENASEVLTNVTTIQEDINKSKGEINTAKESVDKSLKKVYSAVTEATNQAKKSEKQAGIATSKANQTSADKSAVETMRNEVSSMKTSIEQIKTDTQAIKDDVETAKNETLEAKEEVENSLENERIISDKKYARAIDSEIVEINEFGQVECDNEGYMKDIEIESTLPEITQDTREGYNYLELTLKTQSINGLDITVNSDKSITLNGTLTGNVGIFISDFKNMQAGKFTSVMNSNQALTNKDYYIDYRDSNEIRYGITKFSNKLKVFELSESNDIRALLWIGTGITLENLTIKPMLIEGEYTEDNLPIYEQYGASPSLNYPSEFKNILSSFNIKNTVNEIEKYDKQITLPENKFLGTFNGYKNFIKDNKLKNNLKIVEFDGTENWRFDEVENKFAIYNTGIKPNPNALFQICTHFRTYNEYANINGSFSLGNGYIRMHNDNNMTLEEWKAFLTQQKEAGTPLQILYISNEEEETQLEEINLALYQRINNISAEDLKLNFKYNISIEKYIEDNTVTERKISDSKYPKALKTEVKDVQQAQIYADNSEVEELKIKGVGLTQKVREGYNKFNLDTISIGLIIATGNLDKSITSWYSSDFIEIKALTQYLFSFTSNNNFFQIAYAFYDENKTFMQREEYSRHNVYSKIIETIENAKYIRISYSIRISGNDVIRDNIQFIEGTEEKPYEQYGATPSLDFPSEIQVAKEQNISIEGKNKCRGWMNTTSTVMYGSAFLIKADLKPSTKYTISFLTPSFEAEYYRAEELTSNWFTVINNGKRQSFTFTTKPDISNAYREYNGEYGYLLLKNTIAVPSPANFSDVMLVEGDIDVPYELYYGHDVNIPLTNSSIGNYFDVIDRENKVQDKVIQKLILTGNENYNFNNVENGIYQYSITPAKKPIYINDSIIRAMSNYFKGVGRDGSWNIDNSITTNMSNIRFMTSQYTTVEDFKSKIKELYEAGTPVKIYYVAETPTPTPLPEEVKLELDKFKLYNDLNNIFIDNGSLSFKYNKSLLRAFEEQSELSASLLERVQALEAAQLSQVGGN